MMRIIFSLLGPFFFMLFLHGNAGAVSLNFNTKGHCEQLAGNSYSLLKTCLDMEKRARDGLLRRSVERRIISHCEPLARDSYSLFETCVGIEEKARDKMHGRRLDPRINNHCGSLAGDSYSLFETCVGMEERAKRQLGR